MNSNLTRHNWYFIGALTIITLFSITLSAFAQGGFSIVVYPPEIDEFPKVTLFIDAYDGQGKFISGLDLNSFSVLEDDIEMPVNESLLLEPGLHSIIAFNMGATLSYRSNSSVPTRFETAIFDLATWLNDIHSEAINQYSLTSNEGILVEKLQEKDAFTFQLQNYKPNLFNFEPDLTSLSLALDIAAKPNLIPQSKQSILYITPLPLDTSLSEISSLQARAEDLHVPINVWLMAPTTSANSPATIALNQLATSTGGKFLLYSEDSESPDIETYLGVLRSIYRLRYTSEVNQSGAHTIRVSARYGDQEAVSQDIPFSIDLTLPSSIFIDLPAEITRSFINSVNGRELQPRFVTLQAKVVFPDGYNRQLNATRLYVDGEIVSENTNDPFNFFPWSLEEYSYTGEHLVSIEVEDILGFRSISPPKTVMITVESLYPNWLSSILTFFNRGGWILFAILGFSCTLFIISRVRQRIRLRSFMPIEDIDDQFTVDPLIQAVPGLVDQEPNQQSTNYDTQILSPRESMESRPFLKQVGNRPVAIKKRIFISEEEQIIGSDSEKVHILLSHPSVSPIHALVRRMPTGSIAITDLRSKTGTWVNYAPISTTGTILKNGDLVKIGEFRFRYDLGLNNNGS